ncbi:hypothetical protein H0H81_004225 [Sphagnurus paluster]|uniref:Uncharacterized protein n=1 Tax=Sphagnurus paluster TaxID=117069 RepID=A0A9P7K5X2_9AGAR|nr:hypothetical protein H0H81_004225 [Sphagnurus paluster]
MPSFAKLQTLLFLIGFIFFLAEAAPTKQAGGKKQCVRRPGLPPPRAPKKGAVTAPAKGSTSKAPATGLQKKIGKRTNHPSPSGRITLFHGTQDDFGDLNFAYASGGGDFHFGKRMRYLSASIRVLTKKSSLGAFYLTDTMKHAAQYACISYCLLEQGITHANVIGED